MSVKRKVTVPVGREPTLHDRTTPRTPPMRARPRRRVSTLLRPNVVWADPATRLAKAETSFGQRGSCPVITGLILGLILAVSLERWRCRRTHGVDGPPRFRPRC